MKYKVGDIVKVMDSSGSSLACRGDVGRIIKIYQGACGMIVRISVGTVDSNGVFHDTHRNEYGMYERRFALWQSGNSKVYNIATWCKENYK